jgi:hypothetical protein
MVNSSCVTAAPRLTAEVPSCTLTVIETVSRSIIFVGEVLTRKEALMKFRAFGEGYDAHIRTRGYSELILSKVKCSRDSFSLAGSVEESSTTRLVTVVGKQS